MPEPYQEPLLGKDGTRQPLLPTVALGDLRLTRLIIGGNPFCGMAHFSGDLGAEMLDYFTMEQLKRVLFECERQGINAMVMRGDAFIRRLVREYRRDGGGLQWIVQTASEFADQPGHVRSLASAAAAIYHHGTRTDNHWIARNMEPVRELLAVMRDTGRPIGLATHIPEVIQHAEERGWDLDFYMASAYCVARKYRQSALVSGVDTSDSEIYDDADRERMLDTVAACSKPCLVFKILGASRKCENPEMVRETFRHIFARIKPSDAVVVGMFPKHRNQVAENAAIVREMTAEACHSEAKPRNPGIL